MVFKKRHKINFKNKKLQSRCKSCSKEFTHYKKNQRYCSRKCIYQDTEYINYMKSHKRPDLTKFNTLSKKDKSLQQQYGLKKSLEIRSKNRLGHIGEKNSCWAGGITRQEAKLISSLFWKDRRYKTLLRDNFTCQICLNYGDNADHMIPWRISKDNSLKNLQALCRSCNSKKVFSDRRKYD